jgi:glycosyltransferase involved in cell wall biosynthesis
MNQKKLIIFIPSIEGGGVEKNLFIIANYLSKKINSLSVITASIKFKKKFNNQITIICPKKKFLRSRRLLKYFICIIYLIREIIKNKNIVVFSFQANIYAILICKLFNIRIIIRANSSPSGWSLNFYKFFIFKKILKLANIIIVNSIAFQNEIKNKFKIKSLCIYNPLNINEIIYYSKIKNNNFFFKNKNITKIISVGRLVEQKNQIILLKAINYLKDKIKIRAIILGRGINKFLLKKYIDDNNLNNIVKILNFKKNPFNIIKKSDVFILTSKYEGLPNVLLEALAIGKFVISSNCPTGPREILCNGKGGLLFKNNDYKDLANKILFFYHNKFICKKKLLYAKTMLRRFNYNNNLKKYFKVVNEQLTI